MIWQLTILYSKRSRTSRLKHCNLKQATKWLKVVCSFAKQKLAFKYLFKEIINLLIQIHLPVSFRISKNSKLWVWQFRVSNEHIVCYFTYMRYIRIITNFPGMQKFQFLRKTQIIFVPKESRSKFSCYLQKFILNNFNAYENRKYFSFLNNVYQNFHVSCDNLNFMGSKEKLIKRWFDKKN